jgi:DNA-binding NtrC family response regulator
MSAIRKVLVVTADDRIGFMLASAEGDDFSVDLVDTRAGMLRALASTRYQVVVLDLAISDADGLMLARPAMRPGRNVIVVPNTPSQYVEAAAKHLSILTKPFCARRLIAMISRAVVESDAEDLTETSPAQRNSRLSSSVRRAGSHPGRARLRNKSG